MSSYRESCDEFRARVLEEGLESVARERATPAQSTLQKHVKGRCICAASLPAVEFVGKGPAGEWRFVSEPDCPGCGRDDQVEATNVAYHCYRCKRGFDIDEVLRGARAGLEEVPADD